VTAITYFSVARRSLTWLDRTAACSERLEAVLEAQKSALLQPVKEQATAVGDARSKSGPFASRQLRSDGVMVGDAPIIWRRRMQMQSQSLFPVCKTLGKLVDGRIMLGYCPSCVCEGFKRSRRIC
jgi:hypothetical protein